MTDWDPAALALVQLLPRTGRGPRRAGVYALWLTLRVAQDLRLQPPVADRAMRRRLAALETRLSSLTLPPPLRRALTAALLQLKEGGAAAVPVVLSTLVAPARETAGTDAGEALQHAARAARQPAATPSR